MSLSRKEVLAVRISALQAELAALETQPEEPKNQGATVTFQIRFKSSQVVYIYAARKSQAYWYVTGPKRGAQAMSWEQLMDWIHTENEGGLAASKLTLVCDWRTLI